MLVLVVTVFLAMPTQAQESAPAQPIAPQTPDLVVPGFPADPTAGAPLDAADGPADLVAIADDASTQAITFLRDGGATIWAIAALSVITVALILWKIWRLALIGAWSRGKAGRAIDLFVAGQADLARTTVAGRRGIRAKVAHAAIAAIGTLPDAGAREETARVAKKELANAATGLRALELIATIAPLLGLLGTVLGMIAAFQALQEAGNNADPALLAGGIWEALLTTAAGMAVAIPASVALTWFEAVIDRIRRDVEDNATRLFLAKPTAQPQMAAA
ncbi:MAG: MotA/TolQ/ExbB proton channel family protein [Pseudomonadota bacterium]